MKTPACLASVAFILFYVSAGFVVGAEPKTDVANAIKKLADQSGYAWVWTPKTEGSESGRRQKPIEGKTEKDGFTRIKSSSGDTEYEAGFKGEKLVVNYNGDWLSADEIGENNNAIRRLRAFKKPVEEAEDLLKRTKELKREADGVYAGDMTPEAAKELFALVGRRAAEAAAAQGSMKFWVADDQLSKYEFAVRGKITAGEDKREVEISRTITVEIKDVGKTKVAFPADATKKLSAP